MGGDARTTITLDVRGRRTEGWLTEWCARIANTLHDETGGDVVIDDWVIGGDARTVRVEDDRSGSGVVTVVSVDDVNRWSWAWHIDGDPPPGLLSLLDALGYIP
jgi:hypothetical protein